MQRLHTFLGKCVCARELHKCNWVLLLFLFFVWLVAFQCSSLGMERAKHEQIDKRFSNAH